MKFILIQQKAANSVILIPVIFSDTLVHKNVFEINQMLLREMYRQHGWENATCISAGFYNPYNGTCYGESETLGINCKEGTTDIIRNINYVSCFNKDFKL